MYTTLVTTPDKALCHLFIHCCFKDGVFSEEEIDDVADKFVKLGLHKELNFKDELTDYKSYHAAITDASMYIEYLLKLIAPTNNLALYSYCIELGVSDHIIDNQEHELFEIIGTYSGITPDEQAVIQKLTIQRKLVATQKYF